MNFSDLSRRALYTVISLFILAALLVFAYAFPVQWIITCLAAILGAVAIWEFTKLAKMREQALYRQLLICATVFVIVGFSVSTLHSSLTLLPLILLFLSSIGLFLFHFNKIEGCIQSIAQGFFALFYIAVPLGLILRILYLDSSCHVMQEGRLWVVYLLIVTKITDVGAYFGGRLFGNKKLAAKISPGKTVMGAIAGFLSAVIFSFLFSALDHVLPNFHISFTESLYLGAVIGVLGQVGDLAESLIKRDANVKDSNRLPGLGGVLDMLDSLLFTAPVIYFFLYFC